MTEQINKFKNSLQSEQIKNNKLRQQIEIFKIDKQSKVKSVEENYSDELEFHKCNYKIFIKENKQEMQDQMGIIGQLKKEIAFAISKVQDMENKFIDKDKLQDFFNDQHILIKKEFIKIINEIKLANQHNHRYLQDKVSKLKKNLLKVEISKHKLTSQFKRKIFEVLKTKELEITTLQMQIQGQKSETTNSINLEKQSDFNYILNQLEDKYKEIWASSEAVVDNQRQQFLQKIIDLETQINDIKNGLMEKEFYV